MASGGGVGVGGFAVPGGRYGGFEEAFEGSGHMLSFLV